MSSEDLTATLKALTLSPPTESNNADLDSIKKQTNRAPKRKSKPAWKRQHLDPENNESSDVQTKPQEKSNVTTTIPAVIDSIATIPTIPKGSTTKPRRPRNRKGKPNEPKVQLAPRRIAPTQQTASGPQGSAIPERTFAYVVEVRVAEVSEKVLGVFTSLLKANEKVEQYAAENGILCTDIKDGVSSFGDSGFLAKSWNAKATRRTWPNGMSEVRPLVSCRFDWIKVLPKEFITSDENHEDTEKSAGLGKYLYLALDAIGSGGLFVISASGSKEGAWEACRKYWTQLSYCSAIENGEQWFDERGMFHFMGIVGGRRHHWFVDSFAVDGAVGGGGGGLDEFLRGKMAKSTKG